MVQMNISSFVQNVDYVQNRNRVTGVENKPIITGGERKGVMQWEILIDIYTLLHITQINYKDLLYSTGNSAHCFYNGLYAKRI